MEPGLTLLSTSVREGSDRDVEAAGRTLTDVAAAPPCNSHLSAACQERSLAPPPSRSCPAHAPMLPSVRCQNRASSAAATASRELFFLLFFSCFLRGEEGRRRKQTKQRNKRNLQQQRDAAVSQR